MFPNPDAAPCQCAGLFNCCPAAPGRQGLKISALIRESRSRPHFLHFPCRQIRSSRQISNVAEKVKMNARCSRRRIRSLGSRPNSVHVKKAPRACGNRSRGRLVAGNQPRATGRKLNTAAAGEDTRLWHRAPGGGSRAAAPSTSTIGHVARFIL